MLGCSLAEVFKVDVVGEMVAKFWNQSEWCLRLKKFGSRICDLIFGPADDQVRPTVRLEEAAM
jgi:hypothetical protein